VWVEYVRADLLAVAVRTLEVISHERHINAKGEIEARPSAAATFARLALSEIGATQRGSSHAESENVR
jgi:hypothetical protein